jgi:dTMP kinase
VLRTLEGWVQARPGGLRQPDLTLWFDLEPEVAAARVARARAPDRFEREDAGFFRRVAERYRRRAAAEPQRFVRIDADRPREQVAAQIGAALAARGW